MHLLIEEQRKDPRSVCSVLSEVLVHSPGGHVKYFAPAIVADISASGLALSMDIAPRGYQKLRVRNTYFEADVYVRNITARDNAVRVGCEFVKPLEWLPQRVINGR